MTSHGPTCDRDVGEARRGIIERRLLELAKKAGHNPDAADAVQETARKLFESEDTIRARNAKGVLALVAKSHQNVKLDAARREQTKSEHVIGAPLEEIRVCAPHAHQPLDHVLRVEHDANLAVVLEFVSEIMLELDASQRALVLARLRGTPKLRELGEARAMTPQQVWRDQVRAMRAVYIQLRDRLRTDRPDVYEYFFGWDTD